MWLSWRRRPLLMALGVLVLAVASGALSHTAYARYQDTKVKSHTVDVVFTGVTEAAYKDLEGSFDVQLSANDRFLRQRNAQMTMKLIKPRSSVMLTDQAECDSDNVGVCIYTRNQSWVFRTRLGGEFTKVGNTVLFWGAGSLTQTDGSSSGMATYRVMFEEPEDDSEPLMVSVFLDGFATKVEEDEEDREVGKRIREVMERIRDH